MWNRDQRGLTLIELIVAMIIIGVGLAGVLGALSRTSVNSADPILVKQMTALAEGMMEEILLKPYPVAANAAPLNACARDTFNDVLDYSGYNQPACDTLGNPYIGLAAYQVGVTIGPAGGAMLTSGLPAADVREISVTVTNGARSYTLRGYRSNHL